MRLGIAIIGLNGCGKSTLNHALCKQIGFFEMDVEDYYFPQQKEERQWALEHSDGQTNQGSMPYTHFQTKEQVSAAMLRDMDAHPRFVLSCVRMNWEDELLRHIGLAFLVQAPLSLRLERIQSREIERFGSRVMPCGDMFEQQRDFRQRVASRDTAIVDDFSAGLSCPMLLLDGARPVEENLPCMVEAIHHHFGL